MSDYLTKTNTLRTTQIDDLKIESPTVKTYTVQDYLCGKAKPGQFLMLWIPGIDEIPLSIMNAENDTVQFTVKTVGDATRHLNTMKQGETVGIRGPFGNSFTEIRGKVLMVGGGTGTAPLLFLAKRLAAKAEHISFVVGAKTKDELLFLNDFQGVCTDENLTATTDDGTYGLKCFATEPLEGLVDKERFNMIYTCGPEQMIRKVFELAEKRKIAMEASLERLMRCAMGLCGSCMMGKYRVCRDGPVFTLAQLSEVKDELGRSKLGFDGSRIDI